MTWILSIFKTFCKNTKYFQYRENIPDFFGGKYRSSIGNPSMSDYFCFFRPSLRD